MVCPRPRLKSIKLQCTLASRAHAAPQTAWQYGRRSNISNHRPDSLVSPFPFPLLRSLKWLPPKANRIQRHRRPSLVSALHSFQIFDIWAAKMRDAILRRLGSTAQERVQFLINPSIAVSVVALILSLYPRLGQTTYYVAPAAYFLTSLFHLFLYLRLRRELRPDWVGTQTKPTPLYQPPAAPKTLSQTEAKPLRSFTTHPSALLSSGFLAFLWLACVGINIYTLVHEHPWDLGEDYHGRRITAVQLLEMLAEGIEAMVMWVMVMVCLDETKRWREVEGKEHGGLEKVVV